MQVQVKKRGNSQRIRIPRECMLDAGIDINELLDISASDGVITLTKTSGTEHLRNGRRNTEEI